MNERPSKLQRLRTMHLFAGAGGGILADILLGHQPVCAVENDLYCQQVLSARQEDGSLPWFPIFGDVTEFDGREWTGLVDVVSGGFPCTNISAAGKGEGIEGDASGLWKEMARIIGEVRPRYVFVENSPMLTSRGLGTVLGDLAALGFDAEWGIVGAHHAGAPHKRDRIWIVSKNTDPNAGRLEVERQPEHRTEQSARGNQSDGLRPGGRGSGQGDAAHPDRDTLRDSEQRAEGRRVDIQDGGSAEPRHDGAEEPMADAELSGLEGLRNARQSQKRELGDGCSSGESVETVPGLRGLLVSKTHDARSRLRMPADRGVGDEPVFDWWESKSDVCREADELAFELDCNNPWAEGWEDGIPRVARDVKNRVDRLKCIGNGQVPIVAALAWETLRGRL